MQEVNWSNHTSFLFAEKIGEIIEPLEKLEINYFSYIKQFNNKSRIVLTNFPKWNRYFCKSKHYLRKSSFINSMDIYEDYSQGFVLGYKDNYLSDIAKEKFKLDRGISLIYKNPNFCEFFHFGTLNKNSHGDNYYLNNLINLKKFTFYFRERSALICKDSDVINFNDFNKDTNYINENINKDINDNFIKINKLYFYLDNDLKYFTKRELECIYNLVLGYPAKKSADIMNISKRTYDMHLDNIKQKLKCKKSSEIIFILAKIELLNSIIKFFD